MATVETLAVIAGGALLLMTLADMAKTILSLRGAGPVTHFWSTRLWRLALWLHYRRSSGKTLAYTGTLTLILTFTCWYLMLYVGGVLLFAGAETTLKGNPPEDVGLKESIYFVGTTLSTLGPGDYVPRTFASALATALLATLGTVVVTLSLSYVLPVLSAAAQRRQLVSSLEQLGGNSDAMLATLRDEQSSSALGTHIATIAVGLLSIAHLTRFYPVLNYFTLGTPRAGLSRQALNLLDALIVIEHHGQHPRSALEPFHVASALQSIEAMVSEMDKQFPRALKTNPVNQEPFLSWLKARVTQRDQPAALPARLKLRQQLIHLCFHEGDCKPDEQGILTLK